MRLKTLVYRRTFGHLSTENGAVSSIAVQTLVYRGTFFSSIGVQLSRLSAYMPLGKSLTRQGLTTAYPQRNTRARFNAFLFNVLTPPKGGAPPSRTHPAGFAVLPSPQGLRPSAALRPHPTMERLRRYGLGEPGASAWRKAVSSRACEGAKPPHTPQPGRRGSTGRAILKHRSSSTAAGFTPRKGVGQLGRWRGKRPSSVNET